MKKGLCILLSVFLVICSVSFALGETLTKELLTAETWKALSGTTIAFHEDGTGVFTYTNGSAPATMTWSINGEKIEYSFDSYPSFSFNLTCGEEDGQVTIMVPNGATFYRASYVDELLAKYEGMEYEAKPLALGETISIDGADMKIDSFRTGKKIIGSGNSGITLMARNDSETVFCLFGTMENTGGDALLLSNMKTELIFDGEAYPGNTYVEYDGAFVSSLDPLCDGALVIGAYVPKSVAENYTTLTLKIAVNDGMKGYPALYQMAQYVFELNTTREELSGAELVIVRERSCFEDVPELPDPTSFVDVFKSGSGKSSANGKVTKNEVRFRSSSDEDIKMLLDTYLAKIQEEGFTVKASGGTYTIYSGKKKLASVSISSDQMIFNLIP